MSSSFELNVNLNEIHSREKFFFLIKMNKTFDLTNVRKKTMTHQQSTLLNNRVATSELVKKFLTFSS